MKWKVITVFAFVHLFAVFAYFQWSGAPVQAAATKQKVIHHAKVERQSDGKLKISWESSEKSNQVKIYWSSSSEIGKQHATFLTRVTNQNTVIVADPNPKARSYFLLKSKGDTVIVAERLVPLKGTTNFRDLGGYQTKDGQTVKWGYLFRSDELIKLTEEDKQYLQNSGLKTIVDYRTNNEVAQKPDPVIAGIENLRLTVKDEQTDVITAAVNAGNFAVLGEPGEFLTNANKIYVTDPAYPQLVQTVLQQDKLGLVQHCTAGKDRTGFGSAILLLLLGVPEETVIQDYLLSNTYRETAIKQTMEALKPLFKTEKDREVFQALLEVRRSYLEAALNDIKANYGTFDNYAEQFLGVSKQERHQLKKMFLEK
ncbi:tyrosine-protein phosphatase [Shimazuella kribbensis]|uniref:tyrosine-protein phosphatase n=1 Tax=Shimazuella kribbensis TaxID=139808 RepID=UPI0004060CEA|nr:tyrosine-protein phosphatase [Shimazuella kribbensis]